LQRRLGVGILLPKARLSCVSFFEDPNLYEGAGRGRRRDRLLHLGGHPPSSCPKRDRLLCRLFGLVDCPPFAGKGQAALVRLFGGKGTGCSDPAVRVHRRCRPVTLSASYPPTFGIRTSRPAAFSPLSPTFPTRRRAVSSPAHFVDFRTRTLMVGRCSSRSGGRDFRPERADTEDTTRGVEAGEERSPME
jgi:hypothetical protein